MKYKMPKSMRDKRRYIKFSLDGDIDLSEEELRRALWDSALKFLGVKGASGTHLWISLWDREEKTGIVRCSIGSVDDIIVSMKMITEIHGERVNFLVSDVSGTIKSLESQ